MGPCWLQIKNPEVENKGVRILLYYCIILIFLQVSWCKLEATVANPKDVSPLTESSAKDMPPLTIMSLSLRTVVNHADNKREIVCIAARIWEGSE